MSRDPEAKQRLFFALWPDDRVRSQLAAAARRWTQRPVADAGLHITLVFLGSHNAAQRRCFSEAVAAVRGEAFELTLDYLGTWPRRGIRWLGTSHIPGALTDLVRQLNQALQACGFEAEKRHFVPHVTLSRKEKNPQPDTAVEAIRWEVPEFVLVESVTLPDGVCYQPVQRWPLRKNRQAPG